MSKKHLMIAINWYGPYNTLEDARCKARHDYNHGLYLAIGKRKHERKRAMQYIGIGNNLHTRLNDRHHKLADIVRERSLWLGEIATAEPSGKRMKATLTTLDFAEWMHARFLKLPLNDKKTKQLPSRSVTVINRWYATDYETLRLRRPHADWPDLLDYSEHSRPARAVWFGSRQRTFLAPDYAMPDSK